MNFYQVANLLSRGNATKKAAKEMLKENGLRQVLAPQVLAEAERQKEVRKNRIPIRSFGESHPDRLDLKRKVVVFSGELMKRRNEWVMRVAKKHFKENYRTCGTSVQIFVSLGSASYQHEFAKDWDGYAKSCPYPLIHHYIKLAVDRNWISKVEKLNLAVVDGLMTLSVETIRAINEVEIVKCHWLVQRRGFDCTVEHGYIARRSGIAFHAGTIAEAIKGLRKKIKAEKKNRVSSQFSSMEISELIGAAKRIESKTVTIAMARRTGACDAGIQNWCAKTGIDYTKGKTTLGIIADAYRTYPDHHARKIIESVLVKQTE